jgi:hypothetical protein
LVFVPYAFKGKSLSRTIKAYLNTKYLLKKVVAMGLSGKLLQIIVPGVIIFAMVAAAGTTATNAKPGCTSKCGDVEIPFPFGLTDQIEACYLDKSFDITCVSGIPIIGDLPVTSISIETYELHVSNYVAQDRYINWPGQHVTNNKP